MKKRSSLAALILAGALLLALAACGGGPAETGASGSTAAGTEAETAVTKAESAGATEAESTEETVPHEPTLATAVGLTVEDPHELLTGADFTALEKLYEGRSISYAMLHEHSNSGGTSDGKVPIGDWPGQLDQYQVDVMGLLDHRQMRHFYLPEWDTTRFIYGTEASTNLKGVPEGGSSKLHYCMLFRDKYDLNAVLEAFPEFFWRGDALTGSFTYPDFTKERFDLLVGFVRSLGGAFVHAHPFPGWAEYMDSDDPMDYCLGEFTFMETIYEADGAYSLKSKRQYELWEKVLRGGAHVYNAASGDVHSKANNCGVSAFYTETHLPTETLDTMVAGDFYGRLHGDQNEYRRRPHGERGALSGGRRADGGGGGSVPEAPGYSADGRLLAAGLHRGRPLRLREDRGSRGSDAPGHQGPGQGLLPGGYL